MKTPVTKKSIQDHITYSSWKYALLALLAIFGWSLVYSMTTYRAPEEKKIILGVYSYGNSTNVDAYMETVRQDLLPEMEEMISQYILPDEAYGAMILSTRIAARECDMYVLPRQVFQGYANDSAFMPLDVVLPDLVKDLEEAGVSFSRAWRTAEGSTEKHLYGIPCADLPGMANMLNTSTSDMFISVFFETGNNENVLIFFEQFIRDMLLEPTVVETPAQ